MQHCHIAGQSEIAIKANQSRSTYISESMIDIIKITTANLWFSTTASSKKMSLGDSNNNRQPEMAADTGNRMTLLKFQRQIWDLRP